jgi:hypothetical protein
VLGIQTEESVDSDSDIDGVPNVGSTNSSYISAQTLNGNYQGITEGNGSGYIAANSFEDYMDAVTDTQSPSDCGQYSDWTLMQLSDVSSNELSECNGAGYVEANNFEDYLDSVTNSQSPADLGTYDVWTEMQLVDGTNTTLTEENTGIAGDDHVETHDAITDTQSPADLGTYDVDGDMTAKDGSDNLLTEENTGGAGGGGSEWISVNGFDFTWDDWDHNDGSSPYVSTQNEPTDQLHELSSQNVQVGWFDFPSTSLSGSGITVNMSIYSANADGAGNDGFNVFYDETGSGGGSLLCLMQPDTGFAYIVCELSGTYTATEVNAMRVYLITTNVGGGDDRYVDHIRMGTLQAVGAANYEFDREFQFQSLTTTNDNEYLNIFTGTIGTESLLIDIWTGSWTNIATIIDANDDTWINTSIGAYLDSSTEYFRFIGNDESSDTTENTWEIDYIEIHTWTDDSVNYEFDREFSFSSLDFDETNEELAILVGVVGSETLLIDVWTGTWTNIGSIVDANDYSWINISITSYLDSTDEYFRFIGNDESEDPSQNTWEIDGILIHGWSSEVLDYEFDREFGFSSLDFDETVETLAIRTGIIGTETLLIDVWDGSWTNIGSIVDANDNTWVNISISSYLDSTDEYFRFVGNSESGDSTNNTWEIDAVLIAGSSTEVLDYELDWEHQAVSIPSSETYTLTIYGNSSEDIDIYMWDNTLVDWQVSSILTISSTLQWYNATISGNAKGTTMTWNYRDVDRSSDSAQSELSIDYSAITITSVDDEPIVDEHIQKVNKITTDPFIFVRDLIDFLTAQAPFVVVALIIIFAVIKIIMD